MPDFLTDRIVSYDRLIWRIKKELGHASEETLAFPNQGAYKIMLQELTVLSTRKRLD